MLIVYLDMGYRNNCATEASCWPCAQLLLYDMSTPMQSSPDPNSMYC